MCYNNLFLCLCAADTLGVGSVCGEDETLVMRVSSMVFFWFGFRKIAKGVHGVEREKKGRGVGTEIVYLNNALRLMELHALDFLLCRYRFFG